MDEWARVGDFESDGRWGVAGGVGGGRGKGDRCSRQDRKTGREIEDAKHRIRAKERREPSREQIAEAVGLGLADYDRTLQRLESGKQPTMRCGEQNSDPVDEISQLPSKDESPYDIFSKREDFRLLRKYVGELKPRHRNVLERYYFEDLGLKQIGDLLVRGDARLRQSPKAAVVAVRRLVEHPQS